MPWLPELLPTVPVFDWTFELPADTMGGVAATSKHVVCGTRDLPDRSDIFFCLDAESGKERWRFQYPAVPPSSAVTRDGKLDFGNTPRATPLIVGQRVITQGAFGDVHCLDLETGKLLWSWNLMRDFEGHLPDWGYSGSPLAVGETVIVQPGGSDCSLLALNIADGEPVWESAGRGASYSSFVVGEFAGKKQVIGLDAESLGGWDLSSGNRLWELKPKRNGEFQVPTPVWLGDSLLVIGENNGARKHQFLPSGEIDATPLAENPRCIPDTHTPVVVGDFVVAMHDSLWVLRGDTLAKHRLLDHDDLSHYGSLITDGTSRVLALTDTGKLVLFELTGGELQHRSTLALTTTRAVQAYSHPAIVGDRFYAIVEGKLHALRLR